jgi:small subunit ribosomal protein S6
MFIVSPELDEEGLDTILQRVQRYLENVEAQVFNFKSWGLRRLAYKIQNQREGRYYLVHFEAESEKINDLDRNLRLIEDILRHLIVRLDEVAVPDSHEAQGENVPEPDTGAAAASEDADSA